VNKFVDAVPSSRVEVAVKCEVAVTVLEAVDYENVLPVHYIGDFRLRHAEFVLNLCIVRTLQLTQARQRLVEREHIVLPQTLRQTV